MNIETGQRFSSRSYDRVASFYEALAGVYSGGLIRKSKFAQFDHLAPGSRILYLGAGSGEDAVEAARRGHRVTAVDISPAMVARLERRMKRSNLDADVRAADIFAMRPDETGLYDAMCGNYFYNVFPESEVETVVAATARYVRPGGLLMVADMAPQSGVMGALGWLYLKMGLMFFVALGLASPHPIYDYAAMAGRVGLDIEAVRDHRWAPFLPALYRTVVLRKRA